MTTDVLDELYDGLAPTGPEFDGDEQGNNGFTNHPDGRRGAGPSRVLDGAGLSHKGGSDTGDRELTRALQEAGPAVATTEAGHDSNH